MLYLIKSGKYVKIGYTDNIRSRIQNYRTHNPTVEVLGLRDGDNSMEQKYHEIFKHRLFQGEWFELPEYMIKYLVKYHFTIPYEHSSNNCFRLNSIRDKYQKQYLELKDSIDSYKQLIKSLYEKIVVTRITQDINTLQFTVQEEQLLQNCKCYDPQLKKLKEEN